MGTLDAPLLQSIATVLVSTGAAFLAARTKGRFSLMAKASDDGTAIRVELRTRVATLEAELDKWKEKFWALMERCAEQRIEAEGREIALRAMLADKKGEQVK